MIPGAYATLSLDNGTLHGKQVKAIEDANNNPRKVFSSSVSESDLQDHSEDGIEMDMDLLLDYELGKLEEGP